MSINYVINNTKLRLFSTLESALYAAESHLGRVKIHRIKSCEGYFYSNPAGYWDQSGSFYDRINLRRSNIYLTDEDLSDLIEQSNLVTNKNNL